MCVGGGHYTIFITLQATLPFRKVHGGGRGHGILIEEEQRIIIMFRGAGLYGAKSASSRGASEV